MNEGKKPLVLDTFHSRWGLLLACLFLILSMVPAYALDTPEETSAGDAASYNRLRQFMLRQQPSNVPGGTGGSELSPERQKERGELLRAGEDALARRNTAAAQEAFESATYILHGIDTDASLARTYMQNGQYQRALALGSHMAGVHTYAQGGTVLYIWLLHQGGQPAMAKRLLAVARERWPQHDLLDQLSQQIHEAGPQPIGPLLTPPIRLAPYGDSVGLPSMARVVGSATLLRPGIHAVVPVALLPHQGQLWLRNGLGQLAQATFDGRLLTPDLALVNLAAPLPVAEEQGVAPDDPLPGSRAYAVAYVPTPYAHPAWPVMRVGAWGETLAVTGGGPAFDANGRLVGVVLGDGVEGPPRWLGISALQSALDAQGLTSQTGSFGAVTEVDPRGGDAVPSTYERSLKTVLQVITAARQADAQAAAPTTTRPPPAE